MNRHIPEKQRSRQCEVLLHISEYATSQELAPFEALDAIRIAVAVIVILTSGFCRFGRLR
jgi:hypothetical protein